MRFQSPQWLFIGGALIVLLLVGFAWSARRRERRLAAFGKLAGALRLLAIERHHSFGHGLM